MTFTIGNFKIGALVYRETNGKVWNLVLRFGKWRGAWELDSWKIARWAD